jgi:heptaprenyl diphosphate synthase
VNTNDFAPLSVDQKAILSTWLAEYITTPHPELGRNGPVCPFVKASLQADSIITFSRQWLGGFELDAMVRIIKDGMKLFHSLHWPSRNATLHGLVVVFNDLSREGWWLIDEGHRATKDIAVAHGLMIGQFHPECDAPAVHNPVFPVNRGPFPMIAYRNMAFHDILFLHSNPNWFAHYRRRFGHYYSKAAKLDPLFVRLYESASRQDDLCRVALIGTRRRGRYVTNEVRKG